MSTAFASSELVALRFSVKYRNKDFKKNKIISLKKIDWRCIFREALWTSFTVSRVNINILPLQTALSLSLSLSLSLPLSLSLSLSFSLSLSLSLSLRVFIWTAKDFRDF